MTVSVKTVLFGFCGALGLFKRKRVLYSVLFFGALAVVEAVERTYEIARNSSYALERSVLVVFLASALRANLAYHSRIAAVRVSVHGVIYRAVTYAALLHVANDFFERLHVVYGVAVELDVGDVSAVRERVVRRFELDLIECGDLVVDGNVERVRVVVPVCNAGDNSVLFLVYADESAGVAMSEKFMLYFSVASSMRFLI